MNDPDKIIDNLILSGGLEFAGIDPETGEFLYRPTSILESIDPELTKEMSSYFLETTMKLWEKGFIDMDVTIEDPLVKLAEKAFSLEEISLLDKNERVVIKEIIRVLSEKK